MAYKFEKLRVWQMALEYTDMIYNVAAQLPPSERFNLKSQMERAVTGIVLNIAEYSTGQGDRKQHRFLGYAIRSLVETVACLHLVHRRDYLPDSEELRNAYRFSERLFASLQAFRKTLNEETIHETGAAYVIGKETPFG